MGFDWNAILKKSKTTPTVEEVVEFEAELGYPLPNDYRDFILTFNGGKIIVNHEFYLPELETEAFVNFLNPLTAERPSYGLKEARQLQALNLHCVKHGLNIGDDMGTGFFILILDGPMRGSIQFMYKEDYWETGDSSWTSGSLTLPKEMALVSQSFDQVGKMILSHKAV